MARPRPDAPPAAKAVRAGPQSVGRIVAILDTVAAQRRGATLSELAAIAGAPKTSLVGLLAGLAAEGCVVRDAGGRYGPGPRLHALAIQALAGRELVALARPVLQALVEASGETAVLAALAPDADRVVYLDRVESARPIRYAVTVGERRELHCTASGKVLLAHFDAGRLARYLKSVRRQRFTATTIVEADALRDELDEVRRAGLARTDGERIAGASAVAAPVHGRDGAVVATVLVAGPSERMRSHARRNERLVRAAAVECTRLAGGVPARRSARPAVR
ncbi:MAG: IclR family transcriptional regulator [Rubrivivax sp.]|nr:IclR family transcriptional regulator [Burkholderiales bacterium]MCW5633488.1 IclR family transcriptional regulator [Rubrivivax sp.]